MILEIAYVISCKAILDNDIASRGGERSLCKDIWEYSPEKIRNGNIMRGKKTTYNPIQSLICGT